MLKIDADWDRERNQIIDHAVPLLKDLGAVLDTFQDPEAGCFGAQAVSPPDSIWVRLSSKRLVIEQPVIEALLTAAKRNGMILSINTQQGPLVADFEKYNVIPWR